MMGERSEAAGCRSRSKWGEVNDTSRRLLALAQDIGSAYGANREVAAVLVGGSVSRGHADRWSDLELGVFWVAAPSAGARAALADAAGAADRRVFPDAGLPDASEEDYLVDGVKVDVVHLTVAAAARVVDDVTERADPTVAKHVLVATLRHGVPLHGGALLAGWRARAAAYPGELRVAMVEQHLAFGPHWWLEMLAERDDVPYLHDLLCRVERSVLGALFGLNQVYPPSATLKWAARTAESLAVAPPNLAPRLKRVFRAAPREGVQEARRLIDETVDLVDAHLPAFDTAPVRARLSAPPRGLPSNSR